MDRVWLTHLFGTWEGRILVLGTHAVEISDMGTYVDHVYTGYIWYVLSVYMVCVLAFKCLGSTSAPVQCLEVQGIGCRAGE